MAQFQNLLNPDDYDLSVKEFEAIPRGEYKAIMITDEIKEVSGNKGKKIASRWQIIDGQYKGREIFQDYLIGYEGLDPKKSAETRRIAEETLLKIAALVGHTGELGGTTILYNKPLLIKVDVREYNGKQYNDIKGYKAISSQTATAAPAANEDDPWRS
jgi:hypothetical protein